MIHGPYALAAWRVESDFELPELPAAERGENFPLQLRVIRTEPMVRPSRIFTALPDGVVLLSIPDVAVYRIDAEGTQVAVSPEPGADPHSVRAFIGGSVLAILCYRCGLFPLHGAAVQVGSRAVILSGDSGAGKSTLATALARSGNRLLTDDVSVIDVDHPAGPCLWPAAPVVRLRDDAIHRFGFPPEPAARLMPPIAKEQVNVAGLAAGAAVERPIPVDRIYCLAARHADTLAATELKSGAALPLLVSQVHRSGMGRQMGRADDIFRHACRLASSVRIFWLDRPRSLELLERTADLVEAGSP